MATKDEQAKLFRLQELALLASYEAQRFSNEERADYKESREFFLADPRYQDLVPEVIAECASLGGLKSRFLILREAEGRRHPAFQAFGPLRYRVLGEGAAQDEDETFHSSNWTGIQTSKERLAQASELLPVAMDAVENLIASLERRGDNGGPILDHRSDAVEALRDLHKTLGAILTAIEDGSLQDGYGEGLPAEAARYAIRAAEALRDDPLPYSVSAMLLALFSTLGFPEAGAWMSAVAVTFTRKK